MWEISSSMNHLTILQKLKEEMMVISPKEVVLLSLSCWMKKDGY